MTDMRCEGCGFQTGCGHSQDCSKIQEICRLKAALAEAESDRDAFDRERMKLLDDLDAAEKRIATALTWLVSANQLRLENGLERPELTQLRQFGFGLIGTDRLTPKRLSESMSFNDLQSRLPSPWRPSSVR